MAVVWEWEGRGRDGGVGPQGGDHPTLWVDMARPEGPVGGGICNKRRPPHFVSDHVALPPPRAQDGEVWKGKECQ